MRSPHGRLRGGGVALLLASCIAAGCSSIAGTLPAPVPAEPPIFFFRAGAARVELTPPPGYPMGGFSGIGKVGRGHWTRLYARAVHLQAPDGESLALVACDLWAVPAGLADRVAELMGEDARTRHLGRDQLVLAATHTHHSPANFSSSPAYNALAAPKPGFDRTLFEHIAERIHHAVATACERSVSATVRFASTDVPMLARNRSFPAFLQNPEHAGVLAANSDLPRGAATDLYPDPDCYRAIDPSVSVLRIDRSYGYHEPIAVIGFAALHPTVLGPDATVYSSDVFGVAALHLEREWRSRAAEGTPRTVVALFNGAEGDVSAAWDSQGRAETIRIGRLLAGGVREAWDRAGSEPRQATEISHRYAVVPMASRRFVCDGDSVRTASIAAIGVPARGGAEDGRTPEYDAGCVEGVTGHGPAGHGVKRPALDLQLPPSINPFLVTRLIDAVMSPPDEAPLGVYTVGGVTLATVPGEATTMTGHRIRRSVGAVPTLIVGLANGYLQYFATPEEYGLQHYEGASTLWGTYAGALIVYELGRIAAAVPGGHEFALLLPHDFRYGAGFARTFGWSHVPSTDDPLEGMEPLGLSTDTSLPYVEWEDGRPTVGGATAFLTPAVSIEEFDGESEWEPLLVDGVSERDDGYRFVAIVTDVRGNSTSWRSYWTPPAGLSAYGTYRFHVRRCDGSIVHSEPFVLSR